MLPNSERKKIKIHITTYPCNNQNKVQFQERRKLTSESTQMNDLTSRKKHKDDKFLCSVCLKELQQDDKTKAGDIRKKSNKQFCPFCKKNSETCVDISTEMKMMTNMKNNYPGKCVETVCKKTEDYCRNMVDSLNGEVEWEGARGYDSIKPSQSKKPDTNKAKQVCKSKCVCCKCNKTTETYTINDCKTQLGINNDNEGTKVCHKYNTCYINAFDVDDGNNTRGKICKALISKASSPCRIMGDAYTYGKCIYDDLKDDGLRVVETQTSTAQIDVNHGLDLLNEVLNVFQIKKQEPKSCECKLDCNVKDACIQATGLSGKKSKTLSKSKLIKYSVVHEENENDHSKFVILESRQPDATKSKSLLPLNKLKSSSIPQMKIEEIRHSMKENTTSKDAIDEVNRMFAIVDKYEKQSKDDLNRPMIRNGPRILPVVKTQMDKQNKKEMKDNFSEVSGRHKHLHDMSNCKFCQTKNYFWSGGDSTECCGNCKCGIKRKEGHGTDLRCDKCVYLLSCHHNNTQTGLVICECCKKRNNCSHEHCQTEQEIESS